MSAIYRVRQFFAALAAQWRPGALDEGPAVEVLTPAELELFRCMAPGERRHSLAVLARVRAAGHCAPALLAAALLHDVGKTRAPLHLWERPLPVLARALLPELAARWGRGEPRGWRKAFVVAAQHPAWGAEMAAAAGADAKTVALIAAHQTKGIGKPAELRALQEADDES